MDLISQLLELLKYILPALAALGGVYLMMQANLKRAQIKERWELRSMALSKVVPLRLQAYERALLFLERISPENLVLRVDGTGKNGRFFLAQLQMEIRAEYEHNLAQQLYISPEGWAEIVRAKEQVLTLINQVGGSLPKEASGMELGRKILETVVAMESLPTHKAILFLKKDLQKSFKLIS